MSKVVSTIESRAVQKEKCESILRSFDGGIKDLSMLKIIAGTSVEFVKSVLGQAGRI